MRQEQERRHRGGRGSGGREAGPAVRPPDCGGEEPGSGAGARARPQPMRRAGGGVRMRERNK